MPVNPTSFATFATNTNLSITSSMSSTVIALGMPYALPGIFN